MIKQKLLSIRDNFKVSRLCQIVLLFAFLGIITLTTQLISNISQSLSPTRNLDNTIDQNTGSDFADYATKDYQDKNSKSNLSAITRNIKTPALDAQIKASGEDADAMSDDEKGNFPIRLVVQTDESSVSQAVNKAKEITGHDIINKFDTLVYGFSIDGTYNQVEKISNIEGVIKVEVADVFTPTDDAANDLGQATQTWQDFGLKGEGMVISIIDSGIDSTHKDLRLSPSTIPSISEQKAREDISALGYGAYASAKVPFSYNYADRTSDLEQAKDNFVDAVSGVGVMHGQHVAGIAAANGVREAGANDVEAVTGAAPEAQLLNMKIFSNTAGARTTTDVIVQAIIDSVKLHADVINMSIGNSTTTQTESSIQQYTVNQASKAGVLVVAAAGNSAISSGDGSITSKEPTLEDSTAGDPSVANYALSVGNMWNSYSTATVYSIDYKCQEYQSSVLSECADNPLDNGGFRNLDNAQNVVLGSTSGFQAPSNPILSDGVQFAVLDRKDDDSERVNPDLDDNPYSQAFPSKGMSATTYWNSMGRPCSKGAIPNVDKSKPVFAIIGRGDITFVDKMSIAKNCGLDGLLIVDNVKSSMPELFSIGSSDFPAALVSYDLGMQIVNMVRNGADSNPNKARTLFKVTNYHEDKVKNARGGDLSGQMSVSSSWGPTTNLRLKPEISGIGTGIWSLANDNKYDDKTGTSMSSPFVAGAAALMIQELKNINSPISGIHKIEYIKRNITNTALPIKNTEITSSEPGFDGENPLYSPRRQGSGLVQVENAIRNNTYLTDPNDGDGIFELGEVYCAQDSCNRAKEIDLELQNDSDDEHTYTLNDFGGVYKEVRILTGTHSGNYKDDEDLQYGLDHGWFYSNASGYQTPYVRFDDATLHNDFIKDSSLSLNNGGTQINNGETITIAPHVLLVLKAKITLPNAFTANNWVEGYIGLDSASPADYPSLSAPYFGYFGDYFQDPLVDEPLYCQDHITYYKTTVDWEDNIRAAAASAGVPCPDKTHYNGITGSETGHGYFNVWEKQDDGLYRMWVPGRFSTGYFNAMSSNVANIDPSAQVFSQNESGSKLAELVYALPRAVSSVRVDAVDATKENVIRRLDRIHIEKSELGYADWDGTVWNAGLGKWENVPDGRYYFRVQATSSYEGSSHSTQNYYFPILITHEQPTVTISDVKYRPDFNNASIWKTYIHVKVDKSVNGVGVDPSYIAVNVNGHYEPYEYSDLYFPDQQNSNEFYIPVMWGQDSHVLNGDNLFEVAMFDPQNGVITAGINENLHDDFVSRFDSSNGGPIDGAVAKVGGKVDSGILFSKSVEHRPDDESTDSGRTSFNDYCIVTHTADWTRGCSPIDWQESRLKNTDSLVSQVAGNYSLNLQGSYFQDFYANIVNSDGTVNSVFVQIGTDSNFSFSVPIDRQAKWLTFTTEENNAGEKLYHDFPIRFIQYPEIEFVQSTLPTGSYKMGLEAGLPGYEITDINQDSMTVDIKLSGVDDPNYVYKAYWYTAYTGNNGVTTGDSFDSDPLKYYDRYGRTKSYASVHYDIDGTTVLDPVNPACLARKNELNIYGDYDGVLPPSDYCYKYKNDMSSTNLLYDSSLDNTGTGDWLGVPSSPDDLQGENHDILKNVTLPLRPGESNIHLIIFASNPDFDQDKLYYHPAEVGEAAYNFDATTGQIFSIDHNSFGESVTVATNPATPTNPVVFSNIISSKDSSTETNDLTFNVLYDTYSYGMNREDFDAKNGIYKIKGYVYKGDALQDEKLYITGNYTDLPDLVSIRDDGYFEYNLRLNQRDYVYFGWKYEATDSLASSLIKKSGCFLIVSMIDENYIVFDKSQSFTWGISSDDTKKSKIDVYTNTDSADFTLEGEYFDAGANNKAFFDGEIAFVNERNSYVVNNSYNFNGNKYDHFSFANVAAKNDISHHLLKTTNIFSEDNDRLYEINIHHRDKVTLNTPIADVLSNGNGESTVKLTRDNTDGNGGDQYWYRLADNEVTNAQRSALETLSTPILVLSDDIEEGQAAPGNPYDYSSGEQKLASQGWVKVSDESFNVSTSGLYEIRAYDKYGNFSLSLETKVDVNNGKLSDTGVNIIMLTLLLLTLLFLGLTLRSKSTHAQQIKTCAANQNNRAIV